MTEHGVHRKLRGARKRRIGPEKMVAAPLPALRNP
jgi:hypothetical protein